jgi:hypothetical protein
VRRLWSLVSALTVTALGVAGCSADSAAPSAPVAAANAETGGISLPIIGGGAFELARLEQGPIALWFWAPG